MLEFIEELIKKWPLLTLWCTLGYLVMCWIEFYGKKELELRLIALVKAVPGASLREAENEIAEDKWKKKSIIEIIVSLIIGSLLWPGFMFVWMVGGAIKKGDS